MRSELYLSVFNLWPTYDGGLHMLKLPHTIGVTPSLRCISVDICCNWWVPQLFAYSHKHALYTFRGRCLFPLITLRYIPVRSPHVLATVYIRSKHGHQKRSYFQSETKIAWRNPYQRSYIHHYTTNKATWCKTRAWLVILSGVWKSIQVREWWHRPFAFLCLQWNCTCIIHFYRPQTRNVLVRIVLC